jgi:hypothetical protein
LAYGHDTAMTQPKSQISNIKHDGTLSIRNLMLTQTINFHGNFKWCPVYFSKNLINKIWISAPGCKMSDAKRANHSIFNRFLLYIGLKLRKLQAMEWSRVQKLYQKPPKS